MNGKIALVTGGNRGIGFETCRQLGRLGAVVLLGCRDAAKGAAAAATLRGEGLKAEPLVIDVTDAASIAAARDRVAREHGRLHVLVNNAGGGFDYGQTPLNARTQDVRETLEQNLVGPWAVAQAFLGLLKAAGSARLVNVSSGAGSFGDPAFGAGTGPSVPAYAASKAALNVLTVKLALELKGSGVLVNSVCPGFTATRPGLSEMGARPVAEGAASVVWAAALPDGGPSGGFFRDGKAIPW